MCVACVDQTAYSTYDTRRLLVLSHELYTTSSNDWLLFCRRSQMRHAGDRIACLAVRNVTPVLFLSGLFLPSP